MYTPIFTSRSGICYALSVYINWSRYTYRDSVIEAFVLFSEEVALVLINNMVVLWLVSKPPGWLFQKWLSFLSGWQRLSPSAASDFLFLPQSSTPCQLPDPSYMHTCSSSPHLPTPVPHQAPSPTPRKPDWQDCFFHHSFQPFPDHPCLMFFNLFASVSGFGSFIILLSGTYDC